jgi:AcrR family transcriptional regulator
MAKPDTKDQILDAAEDLFAEQGFAATSMRQLTNLAGVNLAAVNYHFGTKEDLAIAVLRRRIEPINRERRERLDAMPRPAKLRDIVCAFIEPALRQQTCEDGTAKSHGAGLCRVFGRISIEQPPFLRELLQQEFAALGQRFHAMLQEAAPGIAPETLWWRLHFTVGAMAHTLQAAHFIGQISNGICDPNNHESIVKQLTAFAIGGFSATEATQ